MQGPDFDLDFKPAHGEAVTVADDVQRITVNNPGPFTFHGTNSYIVGDRSVAVIDPGPEDEAHFAALMRALAGREVTHIAVSHTHRDHSPLARRLKAETGAIILAEGPHRAARPLHEGESNPFAESSDLDFVPDRALGHGERVEGDNGLLVRQELQADCLAGVWAHHAQQRLNWLEPGDLEEALNAANAIGDDRLQKQSRGTVMPDSFTHGTSAQRVRWFRNGFDNGEPGRCDTFKAAKL